MKFIFSLLLLSSVSFSQVTYKIVFNNDYSQLPVKNRIVNCGIYSIAGFAVTDTGILFLSQDDRQLYCYNNNSWSLVNYHNTAQTQAAQEDVPSYSLMRNHPALAARSFSGSGNNFRFLKDGKYQSDYQTIEIIRESPDSLKVVLTGSPVSNTFIIPFQNLSCADFIGTDKTGNLYILAEQIKKEFPLEVERLVVMVSPAGECLKSFKVPLMKYVTVIKEFEVTANGDVYQFVSDANKVMIIKWMLSVVSSKAVNPCPAEFRKVIHYNQFVPTNEPVDNSPKVPEKAYTDRSTCLHIADTYALYRYKCTSTNLAPGGVTGPDGDVVKTPTWLIAGMNAKIPYMWGGFKTLAQFTSGLANGYYAGDIQTDGVSGYAVGVDCSGYVSRCWLLNSHYSTSEMPSICTQLAAWDSLKPADAILKNGHVRLFVERTANGLFRVVESSAREWDVSYWTYSASDLSVYAPYKLLYMSPNYFTRVPELKRVQKTGTNTIHLTWKCDTAGVYGYRLYKSTDDVNWIVLCSEDSLKTNYVDVPLTDSIEYFRLACVKNDGSKTTGYWSNVLGCSKFSSGSKYLIVHGFERNTGNWRAIDDDFVTRYGKAFETLKVNFECIRNSEVLADDISLSAYNGVFWILGDESTVDETFSTAEQTKVQQFLEGGGNLFVSGSEIGYDLSYKGSATDQAFYSNYLKAQFAGDNAGTNLVYGSGGSIFQGSSLYFGQTYTVGYPDIIAPYGGSSACLKYSTGTVAGILYAGAFGASQTPGKLVYLGFPIETTANDTVMLLIMKNSIDFYKGVLSGVRNTDNRPLTYKLGQNYPNPFNPSTSISYQLSANSKTSLKIFDLLGNEVKTLVNEPQQAGSHEVTFNAAGLSSGVYFYRLMATDEHGMHVFSETRKMIILK